MMKKGIAMRIVLALLLLGIAVAGPARAGECAELNRALRVEVPGWRLFVSPAPALESHVAKAQSCPKVGTGTFWWHVQRVLEVLIDFEDIPMPDGPSGAENVAPAEPDTMLSS